MNIPGNDAGLIDRDLWDVVYYEDTFALARVLWLDDPLIYIFIGWGALTVYLILLLTKLVEVAVKVGEFVRQVIGVRNDVESLFSVFFLHFNDIGTKSILSGKLKTIGKVIDFLVIIQTFIDVLFIGLTWPEEIPIVCLSLLECVRLQHWPYKFGFTFN